MNKINKNKEQLLFCVHRIIDAKKKYNQKYFAIAPSCPDENYMNSLCEKLGSAFYTQNQKVLIADIKCEGDRIDENSAADICKGEYFDSVKLDYIKAEAFDAFLTEQAENYDIILVKLPPIQIFAQALEYAKVCRKVFLTVRYLYSTHKDIDRIMALSQNNQIDICGAIALK
jgi:hypothetical protein